MERGSQVYLGGGGAIPVVQPVDEVLEAATSTHEPWARLDRLTADGETEPFWVRPEEIKAVAPGRTLNPSKEDS